MRVGSEEYPVYSTFPVIGWLVDDIDHIEGIRIFLLHNIKLFAEQDIRLCNVCKKQLKFRLVRLVLESML